MTFENGASKIHGDDTRKKTTKIVDIIEKIRLQSHEEGPPNN